MPYSTLTSKGQTTIPKTIRQKLGIHSGDKIEYLADDHQITIRAHPGILSLYGSLTSQKGREMSMTAIRKAAVKAAGSRKAKP